MTAPSHANRHPFGHSVTSSRRALTSILKYVRKWQFFPVRGHCYARGAHSTLYDALCSSPIRSIQSCLQHVAVSLRCRALGSESERCWTAFRVFECSFSVLSQGAHVRMRWQRYARWSETKSKHFVLMWKFYHGQGICLFDFVQLGLIVLELLTN